jgi:predicted transposase YbfD/YdcC
MITQKPLDYYEQHEKGHGRHSSWYVSVFDVVLNGISRQWKNLRRFIHVHKHTIKKKTESISDRLYMTDLYETSAQFYHEGIRGHWTIENSLHWVKDVIHNEDKNRIRTGNGPVNQAIFSSIAINIQRKVAARSVTDNNVNFSVNFKDIFKLIRT